MTGASSNQVGIGEIKQEFTNNINAKAAQQDFNQGKTISASSLFVTGLKVLRLNLP